MVVSGKSVIDTLLVSVIGIGGDETIDPDVSFDVNSDEEVDVSEDVVGCTFVLLE